MRCESSGHDQLFQQLQDNYALDTTKQMLPAQLSVSHNLLQYISIYL